MSISTASSAAPAVEETAEVVDEAPRRRGYAGLWAVPATLITLVVGGYQAGARELWEDEYATWHAATLGQADFTRLIGHIDLALSPYYLVMHFWIVLFGDSELALRAPSVIAMAVTSGLLVLLGRRLFNTGVGLLAGLLFAVLPSVSRYAQEARPYALAMMLAVLATLVLLRTIDRPTWPRWLWYGVLLVLLGLTHVVALAVLVGHLLYVRQAARDKDLLRVWRWLAPVLLAVSVIGPFMLTASGQSQAISWIKAGPGVLRSYPSQLFGSGVLALAVVGLAVAGLYLLVRSPGPALPMLTAWAVFPPVFTYLTFPFLHLFEFRYLLFTLAAWVLLAAAGIDAIGRRCGARRPAIAATVAAVLALGLLGWLAVPGEHAARHDPALGNPDYRDAALTIHASLQVGDAIAYGGAKFLPRRGMAYEMRDMLRPRDIFLAKSAEQRGYYTATECAVPASCLGTTRRIWLVTTTQSRDVFAELPPLTATLLRERCTVVAERDFQHLRLVLLTVSG